MATPAQPPPEAATAGRAALVAATPPRERARARAAIADRAKPARATVVRARIRPATSLLSNRIKIAIRPPSSKTRTRTAIRALNSRVRPAIRGSTAVRGKAGIAGTPVAGIPTPLRGRVASQRRPPAPQRPTWGRTPSSLTSLPFTTGRCRSANNWRRPTPLTKNVSSLTKRPPACLSTMISGQPNSRFRFQPS